MPRDPFEPPLGSIEPSPERAFPITCRLLSQRDDLRACISLRGHIGLPHQLVGLIPNVDSPGLTCGYDLNDMEAARSDPSLIYGRTQFNFVRKFGEVLPIAGEIWAAFAFGPGRDMHSIQISVLENQGSYTFRTNYTDSMEREGGYLEWAARRVDLGPPVGIIRQLPPSSRAHIEPLPHQFDNGALNHIRVAMERCMAVPADLLRESIDRDSPPLHTNSRCLPDEGGPLPDFDESCERLSRELRSVRDILDVIDAQPDREPSGAPPDPLADCGIESLIGNRIEEPLDDLGCMPEGGMDVRRQGSPVRAPDWAEPMDPETNPDLPKYRSS